LKNRANLTVKQQDTLTWLTRPSMHLATARAHRWREDFQEFYDLDTGQAPGYLRSWCYGAKRSRLQPIKDFVKLVETHWDGIVGWHDTTVGSATDCWRARIHSSRPRRPEPVATAAKPR